MSFFYIIVKIACTFFNLIKGSVNYMRIALDAMGGDNAPDSNIQGAVMAAKEMDIKIFLLGDKDVINKKLKEIKYNKDNIDVIHCSETIENEETPVKAVRTKKDSSLVVGLNMIKEGKADAFVSAGSTGAILAGGLFILGRIKGIDRPALTGVFPTKGKGSVLLDLGANAECKPKNLDQFALMGSIYAKNILSVDNPTVALVNIGSEAEKGNELYKTAHELMKNNESYNFVGNIEARDIPDSEIDVIVCDGFTGNIILKMTEGVVSKMMGLIKNAILSDIKSKVAGLLLKKSLKNIKKSLDSEEHGGVLLLGVNGILIKAHGSSSSKAIKNAIKQAKKFHDSQSVNKIIDYAQKM